MKRIIDADPDRDQLLRDEQKPGSKSKTTDSGKPDAPKGHGRDRIAEGLKAANHKMV